MKKIIFIIAFLSILNFSCSKKSTPAPVITPPPTFSVIGKWYITKTIFNQYNKDVLQATVITTGNNVDYYSFDADKSGTVLEEGTILSDPTISNFTYVATPTTLAITFAPGTIPGEANDVQ